MSKLTREEFIEKAKKVHDDKYDYSLVEYVSNRIKVKIICPEHEEFEQNSNNHLNGQGCPKCGKEKLKNIIINNIYNRKNIFINNSKKIHNDKYDYSLVDYKNTNTKVKIICPIHGEFNQLPLHHQKGVGCYRCNGGYQLNLEDFIQRSNITHDNKYDYSKSIYTKAKNKLIIICPIHGEFEQDAYSHAKKCGCPKCNGGTNLTYSNDNKYLYLFKDSASDLIKIGISWNPEKRLNVISNNITLLKQYENCSFLEKNLHIKYKNQQFIHTLYEDGKTEWFKLSNNDIKNIDRYIKLYNINLNYK